MSKTVEVPLALFTSASQEAIQDSVVRELPLTIILDGRELLTTLCSPADLEYLVAGILVSEGLVTSRGDVRRMKVDEDAGVVHVESASGKLARVKSVCRPLVASGGGKGNSSYGLGSLEEFKVQSQTMVAVNQVLSLVAAFLHHSAVYQSTHGVHSAALCDSSHILIFNDDIGRHNALDKVFGQCLLQDIPTENRIVITSGRISSEILLKVAKRHIPILISKASPTSLGVKLATELGMTLIVSVREKSLNVYSHAWRVVCGD